ncbi:MAG: signal peptidase II [Azovibrio sp.]
MRKSLPWLGLAGLVILLDQLSKWWVLGTFQEGESLPVTGFFNLILVYNPGAAFSFLAGAGGIQKWFFVILALGISAWIVFMLIRHPEQKRQSLALSLILGGAIGNVVDRIAYGAVVDFLDVYVGTYHWPAFNVADAAITLGAILMVWDALRKSPEPA